MDHSRSGLRDYSAILEPQKQAVQKRQHHHLGRYMVDTSVKIDSTFRKRNIVRTSVSRPNITAAPARLREERVEDSTPMKVT
jgi:hypothetical protein